MRQLLLATLPIVVIAGIGIYLFTRASLLGRFDDALTTRAQALVNVTSFDHGSLEFEVDEKIMPQYKDRSGNEVFELRYAADDLASGERIIDSSSSLGTLAWCIENPVFGVITNALLPNGARGRVLAIRFTPRLEIESEPQLSGPDAPLAQDTVPAPELVLWVGRARADLDQTLSVLAISLIGTGIVLAVCMVAATRFSLQRGLLPVVWMAEEVQQIGPSDLKKRLITSDMPKELLPIGERLNQLLGRMDAAFIREKRMTAAAAHELRTPIAEIKAVTELALNRPRADAEYIRALNGILDVTARMESSVTALLRLARVESGAETVQLETINLSEAIAPCWTRLVGAIKNRSIQTSLEGDAECRVLADRAMLHVVLENLLINAASYTPVGGRISCGWQNQTSETIELCIENTTLPDRAHPTYVAEANPPKSAGLAHLGVGLAIAQAMTIRMGGTLTISNQSAVSGDPTSGFGACVELRAWQTIPTASQRRRSC